MRTLERLDAETGIRAVGSVARVVGHEVEIRGLRLRVGDMVTISSETMGDLPAEVIGVGTDGMKALVLGETQGLGRGDRVTAGGEVYPLIVGPELIGRVIDALGRPLDGGPPLTGEHVSVHGEAPTPLVRRRIAEPLPVGVRLIDTLTTVGRGQRVGIFAGSGVGKSTLLGMMARGTTAQINVICLVGERGREVREFVEDDLGPEGLARSVVVVATSDQPPLVRLRAGFLATRISEYFADNGVSGDGRGADVLLMLDSLTRLAMAQRDVGLAAGEPPTARGYTPSVFSLLPKLLERAGPREHGTVTAFYTVLVDGDDMNDPIADAARSILDGHLVLDRSLTTMGVYPPIDPLASLSRLATKVVSPEMRDAAVTVRRALAAAAEVRDLVEVGAYVSGTNPAADIGLALKPAITDFLRQQAHDQSTFDDAWAGLAQIAAAATQIGQTA